MSNQLVENPTYTGFLSGNLTVEPLGGPKNVKLYTDRFPDEIYHKAPESHLIRFLTALIGPAGIGSLRKDSLNARLILEASGLELFDLDSFYANPLSFPRILEESYLEDPSGLLPSEALAQIRSTDSRYKNRVLDFISGAKAGNSPFGMRLVAKSGLGHDAQIIENYKYLFDQHSDDPIGFDYYGKTLSTEEMIVLPSREVSRSEVQTVEITGDPTGGNFTLVYKGRVTATIDWDADSLQVQEKLEDLPTIGQDNVQVTGGPAPLNPFIITFRGALAGEDVFQLRSGNTLSGGVTPKVLIATRSGGYESWDETVNISSRLKKNLQEALDRVKPMTTIPTLSAGKGTQSRQIWNKAFASSEYNEVIRYVTGTSKVAWPTVDKVFWIERDVEKEAPRAPQELRHHYEGFHNVKSVASYYETALDLEGYQTGPVPTSDHIGQFGPPQTSIPSFDFLRQQDDDSLVYTADRSLADYFEPLLITNSTVSDTDVKQKQLFNGIYPSDYIDLPGVPPVLYKDEQFWASEERTKGAEYLEIDLGRVCAVNFLAFEMTKKPVDIGIDYDILDLGPEREFIPVHPSFDSEFNTSTTFEPNDQNPWNYLEFFFENALGQIPFTRYIRISLKRQNNALQRFLTTPSGEQLPWSIEVKNLRIGRNLNDG